MFFFQLKMWKQLFCVTVLIATVYSQGAIQGGSLDDLISSVFNTTETKIDPIGDPNTNVNPTPVPNPVPNNGGNIPRVSFFDQLLPNMGKQLRLTAL